MDLHSIYLLTLLGITGVVLLVLLAPHLKNLYSKLFKKNHYLKMGSSSKIRIVHQLFDSVAILSKSKTGAIITIENKDNVEDFRTDGVIINADISSALIVSLFHKSSPLHDGAIVISNNKITYAATYYKITSKSIDNKYGARHRAAMGISEQTDALTIIVSEETGKITFAAGGVFNQVKLEDFQRILTNTLNNS